MKKDDMYTMEMLKLVEENSRITQRRIAVAMKISLGLTNSFIKRLAKKGYIKIRTIPMERAKYLLTPNGALEKYRLTVEYMQYPLSFYRDLKEMMREKFSCPKEKNIEKVAFFGSGEVAEIAKLFLDEAGIELVAVIDDERAGKSFFGHEVKRVESLTAIDFDMLLFTDIAPPEDALAELEKHKIDKDKILLLDRR